MTVEQTDVIDIISNIAQEDKFELIISDHLEWDDKNEKLLLLQQKINKYLAFVESGEVYEHYPNSKRSAFTISLACQYRPNEEGTKFLQMVKNILLDAGFGFVWGPLDRGYLNDDS